MADDKYAEEDLLLARCKRNDIPTGALYDTQSANIPGDMKRELLQLCLNVEAARRADQSWKISHLQLL